MQSTTADTGGSKRLAENGAYFLKRDRNKAATIGIYTCKGRQTVRVAPTNTSDAAEAEVALARFVLTDAEAVIRERQDGIVARDMRLIEALNIYSIEYVRRDNDAIRRLDEMLAVTTDATMVRQLRLQRKMAAKAQRTAEATMRNMTKSVLRVWPGDTPLVSEMTRASQLHYVRAMRLIGFSDETIRGWSARMFTAMRYVHADGRVPSVPARIRATMWQTVSDSSDIIVYTIEELAALFNAAAAHPRWWKYMNLSLLGARPMTLIEACWSQVKLGDMPRFDLNPLGKRRTNKRRPIIPIPPTLAAELASWERDHVQVVSHEGRSVAEQQVFDRIKKAAGVSRGSAMTMRKTMRSWLSRMDVPEAQADAFVGHADEGSATGRKFYKAERSSYMQECVAAIEALYAALRPLVTRPFAGAPGAILEEQPGPETHAEALLSALRGRRVTEKSLTG